MIILKTKSEIEKIACSGRIIAKALREAETVVRADMSTAELDGHIEKVISAMGAAASFKGYRGFPAASCISINAQVVHGIPSKDVFIREGDIVSVDVGAFYDGFHADAARTFAVGKISRQAQKLIDVTRECFFEGMKRAAEGNRLGDISFAIQRHAESNGFSVVRELVGHGVGRDLHEEPDVPNYGAPGRGIRLASGMVIAIEPMINMGRREVEFSTSDGWTCTTKDGSLSAHYENTVAITPDGPRILTLEAER